jgi:hypothetical protein
VKLFAMIVSAGRVWAKGAKGPTAKKGAMRGRAAAVVSIRVQVDSKEMARLAALSMASTRPPFVDFSRVSGGMNRAWKTKQYNGEEVYIYRYAKKYKSGVKYWVYHFKRLDNDQWLTRSGAKAIDKLVETHIDTLITTGELRKNPEIDSAFVAFEQFAKAIPGRRSIHAVLEDTLRALKKLHKRFAALGASLGEGIDETNVPTLTYAAEQLIEAEDAKSASVPATVASVLPLWLARIDVNFDKKIKGFTSVSGRDRLKGEAIAFAKTFGTRLFHEIKVSEIQASYHARKHLTLVDARQFLGALRRFFQFAAEMCALPQELDMNGEFITVAHRIKLQGAAFRTALNKKKAPDKYTPLHVWKIMLSALNHPDPDVQEWIPVLVLRLFCGIHLAELVHVKFEDLVHGPSGVESLEGHRINITEDAAGKNYPARWPEISPAAWSWLRPFVCRAIAGHRLHAHIVPGIQVGIDPRAQTKTSEGRFQTQYKKVLVKARVHQGKNALRHSFASHVLHLTWNLRFLVRMMGSCAALVLRRYVNFRITQVQAEAYVRIYHPEARDEMKPFLPQGKDKPALRPWPHKSVYRSREEALDELDDELAAKSHR